MADQPGPDPLGSLRPDNVPDLRPRGPWYRGFRRPTEHAAGGRSWAGRPLTLALGWLLSCVVITAVTLTAVERVGREVSGSQGLVTPQGVIRQQVAAQSAAAASASSATQAPIHQVVTPDGAPASQPASVPATAPHPTSSPPKHSAAPIVSAPGTSNTPVPTSPTPVIVKPPPGATEFIYACLNGIAVGGAVTPSTSPSASASPSVTPTGTGGVTPPPTTTPTPSVTTTPTTSTSLSPSPSPTTKKNFIPVKLGPSQIVIGQINIACSGNSIANANATILPGLTGYTLTVRSTSDPQLDVFFAKT